MAESILGIMFVAGILLSLWSLNSDDRIKFDKFGLDIYLGNTMGRKYTVRIMGIAFICIPVLLVIYKDVLPQYKTQAPQDTSNCAGILQTRLKGIQYAYVGLKPEKPNRIYNLPGDKPAQALTEVAPGNPVELIEGPKCYKGFIWWRVKDIKTGITGWTAEANDLYYFLVPCSTSIECGIK